MGPFLWRGHLDSPNLTLFLTLHFGATFFYGFLWFFFVLFIVAEVPHALLCQIEYMYVYMYFCYLFFERGPFCGALAVLVLCADQAGLES